MAFSVGEPHERPLPPPEYGQCLVSHPPQQRKCALEVHPYLLRTVGIGTQGHRDPPLAAETEEFLGRVYLLYRFTQAGGVHLHGYPFFLYAVEAAEIELAHVAIGPSCPHPVIRP